MLSLISILVPVEIKAAYYNFWFQKRKENGPLDGKLEFPGGKIEEGETPKEASLREFKEEVGTPLVGDKLKYFSMKSFDYEDRSLLFYIYYIESNYIENIKDYLIKVRIDAFFFEKELLELNIPSANIEILRDFIKFKNYQQGIGDKVL